MLLGLAIDLEFDDLSTARLGCGDGEEGARLLIWLPPQINTNFFLRLIPVLQTLPTVSPEMPRMVSLEILRTEAPRVLSLEALRAMSVEALLELEVSLCNP